MMDEFTIQFHFPHEEYRLQFKNQEAMEVVFKEIADCIKHNKKTWGEDGHNIIVLDKLLYVTILNKGE